MIDETADPRVSEDASGDPWEIESLHWAAKRPWRTPRLPALVGHAAAAEILDVDPMTLHRWLKPGSGVKTRWGGFGPDRTRMIPPAPIDGGKGGAWVREDVVKFARDIGPDRDRPRREVAPAREQAPESPIGEAEENVLRAVCWFTEPTSAEAIAERAGRSPRTVGLHLAQLGHQGLLEISQPVTGGRRSFVGSPEGRALLARLDERRAAAV
jgi:DNA-binding transcriptional ArsR family regulator